MQAIPHILALTSPLFLLAGLGYALVRWFRWPKAVSDALTRFVFAVAVPALLFRLMSDFSRLPPVDARLLIAYFGGALFVFALGRVIAARVFRMDGISQSVFAVGGIFANNLLLGIPLAKIVLGDASLPVVSLVLVFNSLLLWTLVTVSVEWARTRHVSLAGFAETVKNVVTNPVVASIMLGTAWGWIGLPLPDIAARTLDLVGQATVPLSLIALGMGLGEFGIRAGWRESTAICIVKLAVQPLTVWVLARLLALPLLESQAVVMLASLPVGATVYLMAREFGALEGPVAGSLVLSTALAAVTTPVILALMTGH
jgi:malonate transporter and related proteins